MRRRREKDDQIRSRSFSGFGDTIAKAVAFRRAFAAEMGVIEASPAAGIKAIKQPMPSVRNLIRPNVDIDRIVRKIERVLR